MTMQDKDQQIIDSVTSELNNSVDNISAQDLSAITRARHQALELAQASAGKTKKDFSWMFIPAGAIVTACLVVVVYSFMQVTPVATEGQSLGQVSTFVGLDLYEDPEINEELDFYEWLDAYESSS